MRIYTAVCEFIEAQADLARARAEYNRRDEPDPDPGPQGSFTDHQLATDDQIDPQYQIGFGRP